MGACRAGCTQASRWSHNDPRIQTASCSNFCYLPLCTPAGSPSSRLPAPAWRSPCKPPGTALRTPRAVSPAMSSSSSSRCAAAAQA